MSKKTHKHNPFELGTGTQKKKKKEQTVVKTTKGHQPKNYQMLTEREIRIVCFRVCGSVVGAKMCANVDGSVE